MTTTLSVEIAPFEAVTFNVKVRDCAEVLAGTTNVGFAVSAFARVIPAGPVQANVEANCEALPFSVTVDVGAMFS